MLAQTRRHAPILRLPRHVLGQLRSMMQQDRAFGKDREVAANIFQNK